MNGRVEVKIVGDSGFRGRERADVTYRSMVRASATTSQGRFQLAGAFSY